MEGKAEAEVGTKREKISFSGLGSVSLRIPGVGGISDLFYWCSHRSDVELPQEVSPCFVRKDLR